MKKLLTTVDEDNISIADAFEAFISAKTSEGLRTATIRSYKGSIKDFLKFCDDNSYKPSFQLPFSFRPSFFLPFYILSIWICLLYFTVDCSRNITRAENFSSALICLSVFD